VSAAAATLRRPRATPRPAAAPEAPLDVRLMRLGASVLLAAAVLVLAALGLKALAQAPWFLIRAVGVDGDLIHNDAATLGATAVRRISGSYFSVDLVRVRELFESVPWVRHATVRRVWPDRLQVTLEEHRPAALWQRNRDDDLLVNTHGELFEVNLGDLDDESLPVFSGPDDAAPGLLAMYRRLVPVFEPLGSGLQRLSLSEYGSWRAGFGDRSQIELGRGTPEEVEARSRRFVATLPQVLQRQGRALAHADLRHRDGYAIRLSGPAASAAGEAAAGGAPLPGPEGGAR
jgi:cell division protein FtsQ